MKSMKYQNGNPVRNKGRIVYIEEKDCVRQRLINALKLWKGEWILHSGEVVDWFTLLQDKPASDRKIRAAVDTVLRDDEEVNTVEAIDLSFNNKTRKLDIAFSVQTIYGTVGGTV